MNLAAAVIKYLYLILFTGIKLQNNKKDMWGYNFVPIRVMKRGIKTLPEGTSLRHFLGVAVSHTLTSPCYHHQGYCIKC